MYAYAQSAIASTPGLAVYCVRNLIIRAYPLIEYLARAFELSLFQQFIYASVACSSLTQPYCLFTSAHNKAFNSVKHYWECASERYEELVLVFFWGQLFMPSGCYLRR